MNAQEIIMEIEKLSPEDQQIVVQYVESVDFPMKTQNVKAFPLEEDNDVGKKILPNLIEI
ncbi:MAG: hypothetical protein C4527_04035 [Candidatus Omnitrophota bacterium]|nr:MAG: hypothetical protein C4527_04035 [Candidatus Omnitrophota bacterium]